MAIVTIVKDYVCSSKVPTADAWPGSCRPGQLFADSTMKRPSFSWFLYSSRISWNIWTIFAFTLKNWNFLKAPNQTIFCYIDITSFSHHERNGKRNGEVAEWSKAMRLGRILVWGMGSNPIFVKISLKFFFQKCCLFFDTSLIYECLLAFFPPPPFPVLLPLGARYTANTETWECGLPHERYQIFLRIFFEKCFCIAWDMYKETANAKLNWRYWLSERYVCQSRLQKSVFRCMPERI